VHGQLLALAEVHLGSILHARIADLCDPGTLARTSICTQARRDLARKEHRRKRSHLAQE